ncbi:Adenoviral fiber protein (repeat/shaft region) [compost metagenome]
MSQDVKARLNGFSLEIRDRFKTGEVPTQDDFKLLIDYIHTLHQLLGLETADGAPGSGPGAGLKVVGGKVAVDTAVTNPTAGKGTTANGRAVSVDAGAGLTFSGNKLVVNTAEVYPTAGKGTTANGRAVSVDAGAGLTFSGNKLVVNTAEVYPTAGKGTTANGRAVSVDAGAGLTFSGNKLVVNTAEVYPTAGKGTTANGRAVSVDAGAGLAFSGNKLVVNTAEVYPTAGPGISVEGRKVSVNPGFGLKFNADKLEADPAVIYPVAGSGINVEGNTVNLKSDAWILLFSHLHGANYYLPGSTILMFLSQQGYKVVGRFYCRASGKPLPGLDNYKLDGRAADVVDLGISTVVFNGNLSDKSKISVTWQHFVSGGVATDIYTPIKIW